MVALASASPLPVGDRAMWPTLAFSYKQLEWELEKRWQSVIICCVPSGSTEQPLFLYVPSSLPRFKAQPLARSLLPHGCHRSLIGAVILGRGQEAFTSPAQVWVTWPCDHVCLQGISAFCRNGSPRAPFLRPVTNVTHLALTDGESGSSCFQNTS